MVGDVGSSTDLMDYRGLRLREIRSLQGGEGDLICAEEGIDKGSCEGFWNFVGVEVWLFNCEEYICGLLRLPSQRVFYISMPTHTASYTTFSISTVR